MNEDNLPEKEQKGDEKLNYEIDWVEERKSRFTYVFNYYDNENQYYFPHFGLFTLSKEERNLAKEDPNFFEKTLYWTPNHPPYDFYIKNHNWQLFLLTEFFSSVFEEDSLQRGVQPNHKYFKVILPKSKYEEIMNCINDFELLQIKDLLLEIISIAQKKYVEEISFWEQPEMQKLHSSAEKEAQKVINILEKFDEKNRYVLPIEKKQSELLHINFVFNDQTIKVEHKWLAEEFIEHFRNYYNQLPYKNWRSDLERYHYSFSDFSKKQRFKYDLVTSLYNLFTNAGFFKITKSQPTPNNLMLCIAKILEFCLIPVAAEDELNEIKIKKVRNWLKRNEIKTEIALPDLISDKERLLKYFNPEFINLIDKIEKPDSVNIGYYIGKRFKIEELVPDLIHIAQSLSVSNSYIGYQMSIRGNVKRETFEEFDSFKKLIEGVNEKQKVSTIKFKLEGDDKEYLLQQRLPMYIIEEAIKEYSQNQRVEVDTDLIKTKLTRTEDGSFRVEKGNLFSLPHERFMVCFVKDFYDYLSVEAQVKENNSYPSLKYYTIIAIMLQKTSTFYHLHHSEDYLIGKVRQWHDLALTK